MTERQSAVATSMRCLGVFLLIMVIAACSRDAESSRLEVENQLLRQQLVGPNTFFCTVQAQHEVDVQGNLVETPIPAPQRSTFSFVVDGNTGEVKGGIGNNATFEQREVYFTPPDNPLYVVSKTHGPNRNVDYLSIRTWADGPEKPFILAMSIRLYSGTCRQ